jgi:hypothetical protein
MGAVTFKNEITTTLSVAEAFEKLKRQARREYGNNAYNGTISTCYGLRRSKLTLPNYSAKQLRIAYDFIEEDIDTLDKRECSYVQLKRGAKNTFIFYGWGAE